MLGVGMVSNLQSPKQTYRYPKEMIDKCREDYLSGKGSMEEVGKANGVNPHALRYYSKTEHWSDLIKERFKRGVERSLGPEVRPIEFKVDATGLSLDQTKLVESVVRFQSSVDEIEKDYRHAREMSQDISISSSERTAWARVSIELNRRWQELLRIPSLAPVKTLDRPEKNIGPILPIE